MHLRHIVPALGILASTTGAAFAENAGGLTVGGFVDTIASASDVSRNDSNNPADPGAGGVDYNFSSQVELRVGYKAGDKVTAQIDAEWNNGTAGRDDTYLEQAYVNYAFADQFSVTTGKFTTFAGWVAADADGLYRVSGGPITRLYGGELVGAALNYAPNENLGVSFFLVNGLDLGGAFTNGATVFSPYAAGVGSEDSTNANANQYVSPAVDVVYKIADFGTLNFELGYDYAAGGDQTILHVGANATIKPKAYEPITLGAELIWQAAEDSTGAADEEDTNIGVNLLANHTIPGAPFPMSATGSIQHIISAGDDGAGEDEQSTSELALALLTNPTGDSHFGLNAELAYRIDAFDPNVGGEPDDIKSWSFAVEAIAVIP